MMFLEECVWAKERVLHFPVFCCQVIFPGLGTAAKDAPAPPCVETFIQTVAAGTQD